MKISSISQKGCLGLKEFEVNPGKITLLKGPKGVGKTSVVETLKMFFTNKNDRPIFVNSNSEKGEVCIIFDDGTKAKKIYHPAGGAPYVNIDKDGMRPKSPEKYLKSLISDAQINPISFIGLSDKEQTETVLGTIPMRLSPEQVTEIWGEIPDGIDTDQHALKLCKDLENLYFSKRTGVNSEIKNLESNITDLSAKLPDRYDVEKWRDVKLTDVMAEISKANKHNEYITNCNTLIAQAEDQKKHVNEMAAQRVESIQSEIERLTQSIKNVKDNAEAEAMAIDEKSEKAIEWIKSNPPIDIQPLQDKAEEMEIMKGFVLSADDLECKRVTLKGKKADAEDLTHKIELSRSEPAKLLKTAKMPIDGLGIDGAGNVTINCRPIKNLSDGEKIEFALNIAKATAGPLKLILINGFEALNPAAQKQFTENVKDDEFQYIITCVADGDFTVTTED